MTTHTTHLRQLFLFGLMFLLLIAACSSNKETARREEPRPPDASPSPSALIDDGAVSSAEIADDESGTVEISTDVVGTAIITEKITDGSVAALQIPSGYYSGGYPAAFGNVPAGEGSLAIRDMLDNSITSYDIQDHDVLVIGSTSTSEDAVATAEILHEKISRVDVAEESVQPAVATGRGAVAPKAVTARGKLGAASGTTTSAPKNKRARPSATETLKGLGD